MASRPESSAGRWFTVARLAKTQGRHGEVAAQVLTDFPDRLLARREVWLWDSRSEPRRAGVERIWPHKNYLVFQFTGVETIEAARELIGLEVQIPRAEAASLAPGEVFLDDLRGCRVVEQQTGKELGRVRQVLSTGGGHVLEVELPGGKELLIPFAEEICRRVAPEDGVIEVMLPEGLRELNQ